MNPNPTKYAMVLGGSGAIGKACAVVLGDMGFHMLLVGRDREKLEESQRSLNGTDVSLLEADLMSASGLKKVMKHCEDTTPEVVVHAFGSNMNFTEINPTGGWRECMEMYFLRPIQIDQALGSLIGRKGGGCIVHMASQLSDDGSGFAPYAAAKAALHRYILSEGGKLRSQGVSLFAIQPAAVEGGQNRWAQAKHENPELYASVKRQQPGQRFQAPEEIAELLKQICGEQFKKYGGKILSVN